MKPHITNSIYQRFRFAIEDIIQKMEKIANEEKVEVLEKIAELKSNKNALDEMYKNYRCKLKELSIVSDEYDRLQQTSRIHMRKIHCCLSSIIQN